MEETSYFFRMSNYQERLMKHIDENPKFIQPASRRNEIWARLQEPLADLSVSRTTFSWGIPVPDDPKHVMYVWFDALTNYLSGIDYHRHVDDDACEQATESAVGNAGGRKVGCSQGCVMSDDRSSGNLSRFWPADVHIVGKDITWFHAVIWPCMLMSAQLALPKTVLAHGFVTASDRSKMSKSLGNVLEPHKLLSRWSADTLRYYLTKESKLGLDLRFDEASLVDMHNADLCDTLGNLVHRTTSLCKKHCGGKVPDVSSAERPPFFLPSLLIEVDRMFNQFCIQEPLELIMAACRDTNKYLTDSAPWTIKGDLMAQQKIVRTTLEAIYVVAHFLQPTMPNAAQRVFSKLGSPARTLCSLSDRFDNLKPGTPVQVGDVLFNKLKPTAETPKT